MQRMCRLTNSIYIVTIGRPFVQIPVHKLSCFMYKCKMAGTYRTGLFLSPFLDYMV